MLKIIICEDCIEQLNYIEENINNIIDENNFEAVLACVAESPKIVEDFLQHNTADVFFLDIDFNAKINGLELAIKIKKQNSNAYIVYISEQLNLVFSSFKTHPYDFLPKPVTKNVMKKCLDEIMNDYKRREQGNSKIDIKIGAITHHIDKNSIIFVERLLSKTILHLHEKIIECYYPLEHFEKELCVDEDFVRCHRGFVANRKHIIETNLKNMCFKMSNGKECHIGKTYKKGVVNNA